MLASGFNINEIAYNANSRGKSTTKRRYYEKMIKKKRKEKYKKKKKVKATRNAYIKFVLLKWTLWTLKKVVFGPGQTCCLTTMNNPMMS